MSAGDSHRRANTCVPSKVRALLSKGGAPELMRRWRGLEDGWDIPDLARRRPWRARGCHLCVRPGPSIIPPARQRVFYRRNVERTKISFALEEEGCVARGSGALANRRTIGVRASTLGRPRPLARV